MKKTLVFSSLFSALLTACSGGSGDGGGSTGGVPAALTITESNAQTVTRSSVNSLVGILDPDANTTTTAATASALTPGNIQKSTAKLVKQRPQEAVACTSGTGDITESATAVNASFSQCVIGNVTFNGSFSGSGSGTDTAFNSNIRYSSFSISFGSSSVTLNGAFTLSFVENADRSETFTTNFQGVSITSVENGVSNQFTTHSGNIVETISATGDASYSLNNVVISGTELSGNSITLSTESALQFPSSPSSNFPVSGVLLLTGANNTQIRLNTDTGNVNTVDVTINGGQATNQTYQSLQINSLLTELDFGVL